MSGLYALIYGLVQGLTEFLPVSSSGHLEIVDALWGRQSSQMPLLLPVAAHAGTLLGVVLVYWHRLVVLARGVFRGGEERQYVVALVVSAVPAGVVGLLFKEEIEVLFEGHLWVVGGGLLFTAALLFLSGVLPVRDREITVGRALLIGVMQVAALVPGVSRSGITIVGGLVSGLSRERATDFAFLMMIIPVGGAILLEAVHLVERGVDLAVLGEAGLVGLVSAVSGYFACSWMRPLVRANRLPYFGVYCAVVGLLVLALWVMGYARV